GKKKCSPSECAALNTAEVLLCAPRSPATPNENGVPAGGAVGVGVGVRVGVGVGVAVRVGVAVADRVGVAVADVDGVGVGVAVGPGVWLPPVRTTRSTRFVTASDALKANPSERALSRAPDIREPAVPATAAAIA